MNETEYKPISVGDWIITLIIVAIPIVNLIMLLIWAGGESTHPSKKTYAQASLILIGVVFGLAMVAGLYLRAS